MRRGSSPPVGVVQSSIWPKIGRVAREKRFRKGDLLYLAGDRADALYLLEEGRVRLFRYSNGRALTLSIVEPGDFFGVKALFPRGRREGHAQALSDGRLYAIPRRHLEVLLEQYPSLSLVIMENLGRRVRTVERRLGDLAFKSVPQRLAAALLDLAGPTVQKQAGPVRLPHRYTHQDLAEMINSYRETVTKIFQNFRRARLVASDREGITLLDLERLQEMALR